MGIYPREMKTYVSSFIQSITKQVTTQTSFKRWKVKQWPTHSMDAMPSCFSHVQHFAILWTVAHQAPLSMGFSRQEYWSGLPCPSPGDLPDPGIEPRSLMSPALASRFFTTSAIWCYSMVKIKQLLIHTTRTLQKITLSWYRYIPKGTFWVSSFT